MRGGYQLIDFGRGRKLESLAGYLLDRPSPAADDAEIRLASRWAEAAARFERAPAARGSWKIGPSPATPWLFAHETFQLELRLTEFGHLGVFPEQQENWRWIAARSRAASKPLNVLNLFAYTGGSTLAAAAAGARVTHVDAARSAVAWARRNAALSGLADAPIRWIVDDARRFVRRESRRGRRYDAIVLDPPTYGHGAAGQSWRLADHVAELIDGCRELTAGAPSFMLLTCHAAAIGPSEAAALVAQALEPPERRRVEARRLAIEAASGGWLDAGVMARWTTE